MRAPFWRGIAIVGLVGVVGLTLVAFTPAPLLVWSYWNRHARSLPLPSLSPPRDAAEARLQDVETLARLPSLDRSFTPETWAAFAQQIEHLRADAAGLSAAQFAMEVARLVAIAHNGHTAVDVGARSRLFGEAPLRFAWFADGLYIVRAERDLADLVGAQILAIDGRPVEHALTDIRPYIGGTAARAKAESPTLLQSPALLRAIWPDSDGRSLALTVRAATGELTRTVYTSSTALDPFASRPIYSITPLIVSGEEGWRTVLQKASTIPLSLRQAERVAYAQPLEENGLYVRVNANADDAYGPLADQLERIAETKPPGGWRWLVLDLRFNEGGDELKTAPFTRALPHLVRRDGSVWILTSNATFSAAIITAARAKRFLGARAHIVGEIPGDSGRFWSSAGAPLVLPNSGIAINRALFLYDEEAGCDSLFRCYPLDLVYGVAAGPLTPDIAVGWRFADYVAGRDTVLDAARIGALGH